MAEVEDQYLDVLRNIEAAIAGAARAETGAVDAHVAAALDGLLRGYQAEARGKPAPAVRLTPPAQAVYLAAKSMCDWRLGRETLVNEEGVAQSLPRALTLDEIAACLKRLRRSVETWTKKNGRRGYLDFVSRYV